MRYLLITTLWLCLALSAPAGERPATTKALAPLFDDQTIAVFRLNLEKTDPAALVDLVLNLPLEGDRPPAEVRAALLAQLKESGIQEMYVIVNLADIGLPTPNPVLVAVVPMGKKAADTATAWQKLIHSEVLVVPGQALVAGPKEIVQRLLQGKPTARPELARALDRAPDVLAQGVIALTAGLRRAIREAVPELPPTVGGGRTAPLVDGFQFAHLQVDLKPKPSARLTLEMADADGARELEKVVDRSLSLLGKNKLPLAEALALQAAIELLRPKRTDNRLEIAPPSAPLELALKMLGGKAQASAQRSLSINKFKQLGIAIHSYHDVYKQLPPAASKDKKGQALLSWRVHLLPYLDQEKLYKQFKLDEPWDSAHNKALIDKMPTVFRSGHSKAPAGHTTLVAPINPDTVWGDPKVKRIRDVADGTSNTIFLVEADDAHAVIWTKPDDLPVDAKQPLRGLRLDSTGHFVVLLGDGSVRTLPRTLAVESLAGLFTARGGEVLQLP